MPEISKLAELRKMLLGLEDLSAVERDVYYAANEVSDEHNGARTMGLLDHTLVSGMSRPTFFRALKSLVQKGYLSPCDASGRGRYVVHAPATRD